MPDFANLDVNVRGQTAHLDHALRQSGAGVKTLAATTATASTTIAGSFRAMYASLAPILAPLAAIAGIGKSLGLAAELEQTAVSFTTLLGSAEAAQATMQELRDFGASTPFEFPEIAEAGKKLLAFGIDASELTPTLTALGDVASGLGIPFGELSEIYGKARVQGRLMMEDINQLAGRGIPIQAQLAEQFGVSADEVRNLVSSGKVNFSHLETAFKNLTAEGGQFGGMMAAQSQTMGGLWSTLKDNVSMVLTDIGQAIIDGFDLKGAIRNVSSFIEGAMPAIRSFLASVGAAFQAIMPVIAQVWSTVTAVTSAAWEMISAIIAPVINWLGNDVVSAFEMFRDTLIVGWATIEWAAINWQAVLTLAFETVLLGIVTFVNDVQHFFTVLLPQVFMSFGTLTKTFFENLVGNIGDIMEGLWEFIALQGSGRLRNAWKPLSDGFQEEWAKIQNAANREQTVLEQSLATSIAEQSSVLGASLEDHLAQALSGGDVADQLLETVEQVKADIPDVLLEDMGGTETKSSGSSQGPGAAERGSAAAYSIIAGVAKNQELAQMKKQEQLAQQQLDVMNEMKRLLEQQEFEAI